MANALITPTEVTAETLSILRNNLFMGRYCWRDADKVIKARKAGTAVTIRLPEQAVIRCGKPLDVDDVAPPTATATLDTQFGCDFNFDSDELAHSVDRFRERHLQPRAVQIANEIERLGFLEYVNVWGWVGTAATNPNSYATSVQLVHQYAIEAGWPRDGRWVLALHPTAFAGVMGGQTALGFQHAIAAKALESGELNKLGGFLVEESANVAVHLVGTYAGTTVTEAAGADGDATTDTDGWSSGASNLTKGDVFTIADVFMVNPLTRASTGRLQPFAVTVAISDTAGDMDIQHAPTIRNTGAYQTVNSVPADGKAIVVKTGLTGASNEQNLAWHPEAFALTMAELPIDTEVVWGDTMTVDGYSIRVIKGYDINSDSWPCRLDVLIGWDTIRAQLACRLSG